MSADPRTKNRSPFHQSHSKSVMLVWLLLMVVSHAQPCEVSFPPPVGNHTRWEALEAVASEIHVTDVMLSQKELYAYYFWNWYKNSTRSQRPNIVYEMSETLKEISYRDTRLDMIGVLLFGPEGRSIIRAQTDTHHDHSCLQNIHCGPLTYDGLRHTRSLLNICHYVKDKSRIEEAIIMTCSVISAPSVIDVGNRKIDVILTPVHGSLGYCGRVLVNGMSRMKLHSYGKAYKVTCEPSVRIPRKLHSKIQVCFHRNASRGLCQCEQNEWRSIQRKSLDSIMPPYEQRFIDVKFNSEVFGYVTITLHEVAQLLNYVTLAGGVVVLVVASIEDVWNQNAVAHDRISKWVMRVVGVISILYSSLDTPLVMAAALVSCLALVYVISFIREKIELWRWLKLRNTWIASGFVYNQAAEWASASAFREWVLRNPHRIMMIPHDR